MILKTSLREITRSWTFSVFFVLSLSLGLSGFFILDSFKQALQKEVSLNAKNILSADISVSSRRKLSEQEIASVRSSMPENFRESEAYEFFAMMNSPQGARLVLVKAIDASYPFYGQIEMSQQTIELDSPRDLLGKVWISQDLVAQVGVQIGSRISLGKTEFEVQDVVIKDSTQTFRAATLAPRVFMDIRDLPKTDLIQFGSTFTHIFLYKFQDSLQSEVKSTVESIYQKIPDPAVRIDTPDTASEDAGRQLNYLFDFLGLVAIVGLLMSSMGGAYLFRLYLNSKNKQIAIYRSLGLTPHQVFSIYIIQILILSLAALIPSWLLAQSLNPVFANFLSKISSFNLAPQVSLQTFLVCAAVALLGSVLTTLHQLIQTLKQKPSALFLGENSSARASLKSYLIYILPFLFFVGLSIIQANSWKIGLAFVFVIVAVVGLLSVLGLGIFQIFSLAHFLKAWSVKYSLLGISRKKVAALSIFVSIGLGTMLINLLPQLKNSLQNEFRVEAKSKTPSLFMFDIQDDQITQFLDFLKSKNLEPMSASPLIRSRIIKINGEAYERKIEVSEFKTREEEREARSRNRGVNLSYRETLSASEEIVEGKPLEGVYDFTSQKPFEISIETRYADRMGLKIGDLITFDVQGVELEGQIVNVRKVKWTTFQPNFFLLVQQGVLNDAPKTFIVSIPQVETDIKNRLQMEITQNFSNVSTLDVTRVVEDTIRISDQMSWSLELMSALALLAGYIILFSVIRTHLQTRRYEFSMIKVLGGTPGGLLTYILNEYVTLTFVAALVGGLLSVIVSYGLSYYIFEGVFTLDLAILLYTLIGVLLMTFVVGVIASYRVLITKPAVILKGEN